MKRPFFRGHSLWYRPYKFEHGALFPDPAMWAISGWWMENGRPGIAEIGRGRTRLAALLRALRS